jgi:hypothetical protein
MELTQESLLDALEDDSGAKMHDFARDSVLFRSFENHEIEYHVSDAVHYEENVVTPSKLTDNLWYYVHPHMMGHTVKVGSNYRDRARVIPDGRSRPKPLGSSDHQDVLVLYRCEAHVDTQACVLDASVIVIADPE